MKFYFVLSTFIIAMFIGLDSYAQQNQSSGIPIKKLSPTGVNPGSKDTTVMVRGTKQQDIGDVLHKLFHNKTTPEIDSITSKPQVSVVPAIGYTLVTSFAVVVSGNIAFRNGPQSRISTVVASASYTENKQFIMPIQTNFWTKDNSYEFVGNYSYLKYPQSTYGLGSNSRISADDPMDYSLIQFYETILRHVAGNFYAGLGYDFDDHWDISERGNPDGSVSDYAKYGAATRTISSGFTINGQLDSRDNAINPSKGTYIGVQLRNSDKNFGATKNWQSLIIDVRKYINFPEGSDNTLALWSYDWLIVGGKPPYLDLPATGWDANFATGRGYIQGRFRGNDMLYGEAEYRYKITADGVLGGTVFLNGETFNAERGTSLQSVQPGFGPGLRVKLNKVSNTNISINYGFGNENSRGLFISVGEAF